MTKDFNTEYYDVSTNPTGIQILSPSDFSSLVAAGVGVYQGDNGAAGWVAASDPNGGSVPAGQIIATDHPVITNVNAGHSITFRMYRLDDPSDTSRGWLPDVRGMRFVNSDNTGVNDGSTLVSNANRQSDGQWVYMQQRDKDTNLVAAANENIPAVLSAIFENVASGNAPGYVDITFNPKPIDGAEGQLNRDTQLKVRFIVKSTLPAVYVEGDSVIVGEEVTA